MTVTTADALSSLQSLTNSLIRKALNYSVFIAPSSATAVTRTTLFDPTSGKLTSPLVTGYSDVGFLTDAGAKFSRKLTRDDITAMQSSSPVRSDVTDDETTMDIECEETKLTTLGLYIGVDTTTISTTSDAGGSVQIDQPKVSADPHYRVLAIAADSTDDGEIYIARHMPNAIVDSNADQAFTKTGPTTWGVTLKGLYDSTAGTAHSWLFGGAGWLAALADAGFTAGA